MAVMSDVRPESEAGPRIGGLEAASAAASGRGLPPVHLWNPPHCGDIGMRIARDGTWFYQNSPIGRPALVRLFATILRKDPEGHVLVTPVEKVSVDVEDAPFLAVELALEGEGPLRRVRLRTNVDDWVEIDAEHPLRVEPGDAEGVKPYVLVRGGLWALLTRAITYDLVGLGETRTVDGVRLFGIASAGAFFPIAQADEIEGLA